MKDRSVQFPNRYRMVPVPGTSDIVDLVPAPGEVTEVGTAINKATLLTDETAALYGLGAGASVDDILKLLKTYHGLSNIFSAELPALAGRTLHTFKMNEVMGNFRFLVWIVGSLTCASASDDGAQLVFCAGETQDITLFSAWMSSGYTNSVRGPSSAFAITPTYASLNTPKASGLYLNAHFKGINSYNEFAPAFNSHADNMKNKSEFSILPIEGLSKGALVSVFGVSL